MFGIPFENEWRNGLGAIISAVVMQFKLNLLNGIESRCFFREEN